MSTSKKSAAVRLLEKLTGGPVRLGVFLAAVRQGEGMSQPDFARKLGISKSHLNDIEKGRKAVSPDRAARFVIRSKRSRCREIAYRRFPIRRFECPGRQRRRIRQNRSS